MTYFLPRVVGPAKALELLLNDPLLSGRQTRWSWGIVSKVVARRRAAGRGAGEGREAGRQGAALRADGEALIGQSLDNSLTEHLQVERHGIADSMGTEDLREGVTAFFEGREPTFTGR